MTHNFHNHQQSRKEKTFVQRMLTRLMDSVNSLRLLQKVAEKGSIEALDGQTN